MCIRDSSKAVKVRNNLNQDSLGRDKRNKQVKPLKANHNRGRASKGKHHQNKVSLKANLKKMHSKSLRNLRNRLNRKPKLQAKRIQLLMVRTLHNHKARNEHQRQQARLTVSKS